MAHIIFIQVYHTDIALIIFIILIITACVAHAHRPFPPLIKCLIHLAVDKADFSLYLLRKILNRIIRSFLLKLIHAKHAGTKFIIGK